MGDVDAKVVDQGDELFYAVKAALKRYTDFCKAYPDYRSPGIRTALEEEDEDD